MKVNQQGRSFWFNRNLIYLYLTAKVPFSATGSYQLILVEMQEEWQMHYDWERRVSGASLTNSL